MASPKIIILGAGLSGITMAIELRKRLGLETFTLYERHHESGGTWALNVYPGCACDVPSHWYSLSTELNPDWTARYSSQPEIEKYWRDIFLKHKLAQKTRFSVDFRSAVWSEAKQGYACVFYDMEKNEEFTEECDVLVSAIGGYSAANDKPAGMKGLSDFKGDLFHSAKWNYDVDLSNRRVGVIGAGCSGAQLIPEIAKVKSTQVINFARTPQWFLPRDQSNYSSVTKWIFKNVPGVMAAHRWQIAAISDCRFLVWKLEFGWVRHYFEETSLQHILSTAPAKYHDFLIPKYPIGCKRIILDPGYLACLNQSNVELKVDAIDRITSDGIALKNGEEIPLDVIILATGFDLSEKGLGINVTGREGRTVTEQWEEQKGPQAYLGTTIAGFPNLYTILGPNVIVGHASVVYSTESQVNLIVKMIEPMVKYGVKSFEVKIDAETKYNRNLVKRLSKTVWDGGCKSYYKHGDKIIATYPGMLTQFWWETRTPVFENYLQLGGTTRVATKNRVKQALKALALLMVVLGYRRLGWKRIKNETILFLLMRYQALNTLRGR